MSDNTNPPIRQRRLDVILVALFLAGGIFAACWIADLAGFGCWLLGAANGLMALSAWRLFRG